MATTYPHGIDDLTQREQRDFATVLRALDQAGGFSSFGASSNQIIARTMDALTSGGYIVVTPRTMPWVDCTLTDKGRAVIETVAKT